MHQKFFFVFFFATFYNGVTYASPVNEHSPEGSLPEIKQPTAVTHINKEVETTPPPVADHPIPVTQKSSPALNHTGIPGFSITVPSNYENSSVIPHVIETKTATQISLSKNDTSADKKIPSQITVDKNTSPANDKKTVTPTMKTENPNVPTVVQNISTSTATPKSTPAVSNNTISIKEVTSTTAPISTSSDKVVVVYKAPPFIEEKHFDGPSFIGGIVLTIGLTAIGFIAFKYYKSGKIDMNYRTL